MELLRDLVAKVAAFVDDQAEVAYGDPLSCISRVLPGHYDIIWPAGPELLQVAAIIKHPGFQEEKEWRLVSKPGAAKPLGVEFRASPTTIVPYLSIPLVGGEGHTTLPIDEIVVGPGPEQRPTVVSVEELLWAHGLSQRCRVTKSETEYRGWR